MHLGGTAVIAYASKPTNVREVEHYEDFIFYLLIS